jgi:N-formylglutamate deformylase
MSDPFRFHAGTMPLLVSVPHDGTEIPADIAARMTAEALRVPDTDWHVARLYDFAAALGAGVIRATQSRYVVDLNRDPTGRPLYPGADNTEICPTLTFDRQPIYQPGAAPSAAEVAARVETWWRPYHARLQGALAEMTEAFGVVVLFDAHSIRSVVPRFFDGVLPDFNLGTANGQSADEDLAAAAFTVLAAAEGYSAVRDGRFTGGYITRSYGRPAEGVHALQLEMAQRVYMNEAYPFDYLPDRAARVQPTLRRLLETLGDRADQLRA